MGFKQFVWITCDTNCGAFIDGKTCSDGTSRSLDAGDNRDDAARRGWTFSKMHGDRCPACSRRMNLVKQYKEIEALQKGRK